AVTLEDRAERLPRVLAREAHVEGRSPRDRDRRVAVAGDEVPGGDEALAQPSQPRRIGLLDQLEDHLAVGVADPDRPEWRRREAAVVRVQVPRPDRLREEDLAVDEERVLLAQQKREEREERSLVESADRVPEERVEARRARALVVDRAEVRRAGE